MKLYTETGLSWNYYYLDCVCEREREGGMCQRKLATHVDMDVRVESMKVDPLPCGHYTVKCASEGDMGATSH